MTITETTEQHIRAYFAGHKVKSTRWQGGPAKDSLPNLRVLEIGIGPRTGRPTYVTVGLWEGNPNNPFEFLLIGDKTRQEYVELLTVLAFYAIQHHLGLGHVVEIGRPIGPFGWPIGKRTSWEYVYFALPYTFGPDLQVVTFPGTAEQDHHILWAFPITGRERQLILEDGVDALEQRFEDARVDYWSPFRKSVI